MNAKFIFLVAAISLAVSVSMIMTIGSLGLVGLVAKEATAQLLEDQEFDAPLDGASEVPPVQTSASGLAELEVEDGNRLEYDIFVSGIDRVTQAHIHQGGSNQSGPVVVPLFNASTPTGPITGDLPEGSITAANLVGPLQGKQLSDLIALMQNGQAYVNVHTEQNPNGEIRGTIVVD
ncbi:MAG: CHRD domain-containing protein [Thermoproteota archaeon]|nr:CHRD domain-containing protein [Thermoproteota archaeon]